MAAKFEVFSDAKGKFRFRLKAPNGQIIATGEAYNTMAACMNGIESIKKNAPTAEVKDLVEAAAKAPKAKTAAKTTAKKPAAKAKPAPKPAAK